jgi:hypothetical protein
MCTFIIGLVTFGAIVLVGLVGSIKKLNDIIDTQKRFDYWNTGLESIIRTNINQIVQKIENINKRLEDFEEPMLQKTTIATKAIENAEERSAKLDRDYEVDKFVSTKMAKQIVEELRGLYAPTYKSKKRK